MADQRIVQKWYVNEDDLIGGFDIGTEQGPASSSHAAENVAWGLAEHIAQHIVRLHNEWMGWTRDNDPDMRH